MKNHILGKTVLVSLALIAVSESAHTAYAAGAYGTKMAEVRITRDENGYNTYEEDPKEHSQEENTFRTEPGEYFITNGEQLRILGSDNQVLIFKGRIDKDTPLRTELPEGGILQFKGNIYLTRAPESEGDGAYDGYIMKPYRYSPITSGTFIRFSNEGCSVIEKGELKIYNAQGELKEEAYIPYAGNVSGYILNENAFMPRLQYEEGTSLALEGGKTYTVGLDLDEGSYTGRGSGTVRVYDPEGYVKTVIKLKSSDTPGNDGVEEYTFKLNINETVITEGNAELTELIGEIRDTDSQNK